MKGLNVSDTQSQDKFAAMVTAEARVELPISDFRPVSMLKRRPQQVKTPRFSAIDYHNHLDSLQPGDVLRVMDECGIEKVVNITMKVGQEAFEVMKRFQDASQNRFATIGWMDWDGVERADFASLSCDRLEQLVERGAVGIKFWKDLGLNVKDASGHLLHIDDERLAPIFEKAGELGIAVMFHTSDPDAFFLPIDAFNERYEELAAHPDWAFHGSPFTKAELLDQRDRVIARHPATKFVAAHVAESGENLERAAQLLETCPNAYIDISARASELGRQPFSARRFFMKFADRILFGSDLLPETEMYRLYFRFLETDDEYFEYPSHASRQGRWNIYGLQLPDDVLLKVYRSNALSLLP
jgi:hypothetical protein